MSKTERQSELLQRRRLRAGRLLRRGVAQAEVARRVSVTRTTVSQWNAQLQGGGLDALKSRRRGRPAGLQESQRRELMRALKSGALAAGFATDLWTMQRVGRLTARAKSGAFSSRSASPANDLPDGPWSATRRPSSAGSRRAGRF